MEAVAAASSILTLLELVGGVAKAIKLFAKYQNSGLQIERISRHVETLTARLRLIAPVEQLMVANLGALHLNFELKALNDLLSAAKEDIIAVRDFCLSCDVQSTGRIERLMWVAKDSNTWDKLTARLQQAESMLELAIVFLDV
jgi:hypothetical protein